MTALCGLFAIHLHPNGKAFAMPLWMENFASFVKLCELCQNPLSKDEDGSYYCKICQKESDKCKATQHPTTLIQRLLIQNKP